MQIVIHLWTYRQAIFGNEALLVFPSNFAEGGFNCRSSRTPEGAVVQEDEIIY